VLITPERRCRQQGAGDAYCVPAADVPAVLSRLAHREKAGYTGLPVDVTITGISPPASDLTPCPVAVGERVRALVFTADDTNAFWVGPPLLPLPPAVPAAADIPALDGAPGAGSHVWGADAVTGAVAELLAMHLPTVHDGRPADDASVDAGAAPAHSPAAIAAVVRTAVGPSGTNRDYVQRLREALADRGVTDAYLEEVWRFVEG